MATIRTAIQVQDGMSPAFKAMYRAMSLVLNTFESIQSASSNTIDTTSIQAAREELAKANVVAAEFQNQLSNLNSTPVDVAVPQNVNTNNNNNRNTNNSTSNAQDLFNNTIDRGNIKDSLVNNLSSQQEYNQLLENTNKKLEQMRQTATDIANITGEDKNLLMANNSEYQRLAELQTVMLQNEREIQDAIANRSKVANAQSMYDQNVDRNNLKNSIISNITSQQQYNDMLENTKKKMQEMEQIATDISNITGQDKKLLMANNSEYQKMAELQTILLQHSQEIQDSLAHRMTQWQPTTNMPVFTNTGIERYRQEITSANTMIQQLSHSQQTIVNQARAMNLLPPNAINDMTSLNNRIAKIKTTLQEVQSRKITGLGADKASSQVESLRQQLNDAVQSQERLNRAMANMDINEINASYQQLVNNIDSAERNIRDNINGQNQFNSSINSGMSSADNLANKFKNILATVMSIIGMKKMLDLSDQVSQTTSRLNLIVDDGGSVSDLENKIFASADRTRGAYLDTANVISKLGILAGDSFKNTDEIIAFTELMNKNFKISGASIQEQTAGMYQLTQAMASGKLQGDEFRSIMENAPLLAEAIADYTGKTKGELKELSSEGLITSDVIKNAMFAAADKTEERFQRMPMTFAEAWNKMKNVAIKTFEPVLAKISNLVNSSEFQEMFESFINVVSIAAQAVLELINAATWLYSILEPFTPLILGIVAAYVAFNVISGLVSIALGIMSAMETAHAAASWLAAGATLGETAAQWGLNSALYACPIVWIIVLIVALIVALTYLWFTNDKVAKAILFLWDSLKLGIMAAGLGIQAVWYGLQLAAMYLWLGIQTVVLGLMTAWYGFQTGVEAVCLGVLTIFQGLYNGIVSIVNGIISVLNKIPGVNIDYAETAHFADDFASNMSKNLIDRNQKLQDMASQMDGTIDQINDMKADFSAKLNAGATNIQNTAIEMNATRDERVAHRNDWINGASSAIKDALNMDGFDFDGMGSDLGGIKGDTGKISDSLDITEDDLQYLRDLAEQEVINRFTTAEINIEMNNNNNINNETDLDGIVEYLEDKLYETMEIAAEGVHD